MDTPAIPLPRDPRERAILDKLIMTRDHLLLLKQDRTNYIRTQDVMPLFDQTMDQVKELTVVRAETGDSEENRLDKVLESCFQLLSLFYLTIGRNNEAPATYALTSTIKRLLDHLVEADVYSAKDLGSIKSTLENLCNSIRDAAHDESPDKRHPPYMLTLLSNRIKLCNSTLEKLQKRLERVPQSLLETHEKLVSILRSISLANTKSKFSSNEVKRLRNQILEIGENHNGGKFTAEDGSSVEGGEEVRELYNRCLRWSDLVLERQVELRLVEQYIRNNLEKLSLTQAWSLRETDLYDFQRRLDKIDESRDAGNWLDDRGRTADLWTQRTLLYLIRRSYAYIYSFMLASEPVSEALLPVYNQLQTLKRCLIEVKKNGGVSSVRELYPYSMKLNSLDNMKVDGKFVVNGDIPEGQGSVSELLAECFDLNYELRVAAEEAAENGNGKADGHVEAREVEESKAE
ncbi:hypothetical protein MRS44_008095 [Fusarium solani]|uniref:uncharacterized protein n=1 Tax=Fusarium solani TaxID=169388 RepID=UPI0032C44B14|nr:hypothetical protein MRS44_008095 [Fusarium solani]